MTSVTQSHPVASVIGIVRAIPVNVVGIYFGVFLPALLTTRTVELRRSSDPVPFGRLSGSLVAIVAVLRAKLLPRLVLIRLAFKLLRASRANDRYPFRGSETFPRIPMSLPAEPNRVGLRIRSVVAESAAVLRLFRETRINRVGFPASPTNAVNKMFHVQILTGA